MPYKYLEDVATADAAFEATGGTLESLFSECAKACTEIMANTKSIKQKIKKTIRIKSDIVENLLFDFLGELLFIKDTKKLLFSRFDVKIAEKNGKMTMTAVLHGEKIDIKRHGIKTDIKAVTLYKFSVKKTKDEWKAVVVVDI
ncbi:MAG: archease [Candidatus Aenigmatarchaeota archaeon]